MINRRTLKTSTLGLICCMALLGALACGGQSSSPDGAGDGANNTDEPSGQALISGRVTSESGATGQASVEGFTVVAYRVDASGGFEAISEGEVRTDAEGRYTLPIDASAGALSDVVVEARTDAEVIGSVLVTGAVEAGDEVFAAPMTTETRVEVDVYASARSQGSWDDEACTGAGLRDLVSAELAGAIGASGDYEGSTRQVARAAVAAMLTWRAALTTETMGASESQIRAALDAQAEARGELDADLHEGSEAGEGERAEVLVSVWTEAGLGLEELNAAIQASTDAFSIHARSLTSEVRARAHSDAEATSALFARLVVETQAREAGLEQEGQDELISAGAELEARIETAADKGEEAPRETEEAWEDYETRVEAALSASFDTAQLAAYESVKLSVEVAQEAFEAVLAAQVAAQSEATTAARTAEASAELRAAVLSEAHVEALSALMADARVSATLEVLFTLSACGR